MHNRKTSNRVLNNSTTPKSQQSATRSTVRERSWKKKFALLGIVALLCWGLGAYLLDLFGVIHNRNLALTNEKYDAIIVCGCSIFEDARPDVSLKARTEFATEMYFEGAAPYIIFTGGFPRDYKFTEAYGASNFAQKELGLPEKAAVLEARSKTTAQNAQFAYEIYINKSYNNSTLNGDKLGKVLVVTDTYHVFRTEIIFKRYFKHVTVAGVEVALRTRIHNSMREVLALVKGIMLLNQTPFEIVDSLLNAL